MTTKPPSSLAAGDAPDQEEGDENLLVDASDDVTVEASEEVTTEAASAGLSAVPAETPPPLAAAASDGPQTRQAAPTLLGIPLSSIPLPGVTAIAPPHSIEIASDDNSDEEVTRLARPINEEVTRPSITDDDEEETKVEATDPLMQLDGGTDVATALSEQASVEREKALRRSSPSFPASAMPSEGNSDVEFADPDDEDDAVMGAEAIEDESPEDATANYAEAAPETSPLAAAITRRPPPGAPFGGRLPAPTSSFGLSLSPAPASQVPAPSSSPFGGRIAPPTAVTPFGARATTSSSPAVQIPAPSAGAVIAARPSLLYKKYSIPVFGLAGAWVLTLILGGIIGSAMSGPGAAPTVVVAPPPAPSTTAPLVQPVAPAPVAVTPPPPAPKPAEPAIAEAPPLEPAPKPVVKRIVRPRKDPLDDNVGEMAAAPRVAARPAPKPTPPAAKPAIKKPTKAWVDPFAN